LKSTVVHAARIVLAFTFSSVLMPFACAPGRAAPWQDLCTMPQWRLEQATSAGPELGASDYFPLEPGQTATILDVQGPGRIVRLWFTVATKDPHWGRSLVLRAYWDGEQEPSVQVPLGDFFTGPFGEYRENPALLVGMSAQACYAFLPMPFAQHARLEVTKEGDLRIDKFFYQIGYQRLEALPPDTLYFHAAYRQQELKRGDPPFTVAEIHGRGRFLGCSVSMRGAGFEPGFLEGDEVFYVDNPNAPAFVGTGVEDYFNCAWYFKGGPVTAPLHGCTLKDDANLRYGAYRFHTDDAPVFQAYFKMTLGHGEKDEEEASYSAVSYWYQREPHAPLPPLPVIAERIPPKLAHEAKAETESRAAKILEEMRKEETKRRPWQLVLPVVGGMVGLVLLGYVLRAVLKPRLPKKEP